MHGRHEYRQQYNPIFRLITLGTIAAMGTGAAMYARDAREERASSTEAIASAPYPSELQGIYAPDDFDFSQAVRKIEVNAPADQSVPDVMRDKLTSEALILTSLGCSAFAVTELDQNGVLVIKGAMTNAHCFRTDALKNLIVARRAQPFDLYVGTAASILVDRNLDIAAISIDQNIDASEIVRMYNASLYKGDTSRPKTDAIYTGSFPGQKNFEITKAAPIGVSSVVRVTVNDQQIFIDLSSAAEVPNPNRVSFGQGGSGGQVGAIIDGKPERLGIATASFPIDSNPYMLNNVIFNYYDPVTRVIMTVILNNTAQVIDYTFQKPNPDTMTRIAIG